MATVLILWVTLALALLAAPAPRAGAQEDWSEIIGGNPATGVVALTFDAGGVADRAREIILALRDRGVKTTFFLSGQWVDTYPDLALQIANDGHELSNHTYTHSDLVPLGQDRIVWELDYTDHVVFHLTGQHTRPYFRPPFGSRNARVLDIAARSGFRSVYWTLDSGDWRATASAAQVRDRVLRLAAPGDIVVMHVASPATATALPDILDEIAARGWRVGTVSEVLGLPWPPAPMEPELDPVPSVAPVLAASPLDR